MKFSVQVEVTPREGISDPEGQTIERSLPVLGFEGISRVRTGKLITFEIDADDAEAAKVVVDDMCERFLSNPVIEDVSASMSDIAVVG
jgi:phosphoribosylformylglycinamidine synthase PurS subunit